MLRSVYVYLGVCCKIKSLFLLLITIYDMILQPNSLLIIPSHEERYMLLLTLHFVQINVACLLDSAALSVGAIYPSVLKCCCLHETNKHE